jgi:2,4-didehydro-3-deoxy-L-rhamnonate hydrolase
MQLLRVGRAGRERPVVRVGDRCFSLEPLLDGGDLSGAFFGADGIERVQGAVDGGRLEPVDISGLRIGAPISRPGAVICIGQNYAAHAAETGAEPPRAPIIFFKHPNTVVGPYDDVRIPRRSEKTDWEVELAVVIGSTCRYLDSPSEARGRIAGYTIANDVSERQFQLVDSGGQWSKGKSCETFNPLGPAVVTLDEVPDPQCLGIRSFVNGEPRQDSSTKDMIFGVDQLVWHLSQYLVLEPGDIVDTGTPEGVALSGRFPYLRPGDTMRLEIDGLGYQEQRVIGDHADRVEER